MGLTIEGRAYYRVGLLSNKYGSYFLFLYASAAKFHSEKFINLKSREGRKKKKKVINKLKNKNEIKKCFGGQQKFLVFRKREQDLKNRLREIWQLLFYVSWRARKLKSIRKKVVIVPHYFLSLCVWVTFTFVTLGGLKNPNCTMLLKGKNASWKIRRHFDT